MNLLGVAMKFEFPLNEKIRTILRLETLFERWFHFAKQEHHLNHHTAILVLFEILEIATRLDLRTDLSKEIDRQIQLLLRIRHKPNIDEAAVEQLLQKMRQNAQDLLQLFSKDMLTTEDQEWLSTIKSRALIPGGTCKFDIPSYYIWQSQALEKRRNDLARWISPLLPLHRAIQTILSLLRQSGQYQEKMASDGVFQQMLSGKVFQLLEVDVADESILPEVSGNKYMITIRFHHFNEKKRSTALLTDMSFYLKLCNF